MAAALHARTAAIGWFESDCARGQQNFATLGNSARTGWMCASASNRAQTKLSQQAHQSPLVGSTLIFYPAWRR